MKIETDDLFSIEKCKENPDKLYVFGDNLERVGMGGQAIIRKQPNSFGVATKYNIAQSYSDTKLMENRNFIDRELDELLEVGEAYDAIVFPSRGLGTGLAALQQQAPKTFLYLSKTLLDRFGFNNLAYLVPMPL